MFPVRIPIVNHLPARLSAGLPEEARDSFGMGAERTILTRWDVERVYQRKRVDDQAWRALLAARRKRWLGRIDTEHKRPCEAAPRKPRRKAG